ncbi:MAG: FG-GAP-like repeat-containing protein [Bacteroidota bacterium]
MAVIFSAISIITWAQKPVIRSLDKLKGGNGDLVTINGSSFGTDATKLAVFFGASKGTIDFTSDQFIEVRIPPGATYDNVAVTHTTSGLSGYSLEHFLPSFGGVHGLSATSFEGQKDFTAETGLYDLCSCDLDGDKKNDIITANDNATSISILTNTTSGPGIANITFSKIPLGITTRSLHIKCGDLNGDGKPDVVVTEGGAIGDRIFILQNTSSGIGSFTFNSQIVKLTGKKVKRIDMADLDRDGKPELIISNQSGNNLTVLLNQSSVAAIAFSPTPQSVTIAGAASTDGLAVDDLNGDNLPEIVTSQFLTATSNVYVIENKSTPGSITFGAITTLALSGTVVNLKIGDLDSDGKPDIAAIQLLGNTVSIFRNQGSLSFTAPTAIITDDKPFGVDFGDMDGDGKTDLVIASLTKKSVTVLNNESTLGSLTFQRLILPTTFINRHVVVGDVDGDGKPDIAFTSIDDNANSIPASKVSVFRNKACPLPEVTPAGPHTICAGFPLRLKTTAIRGTIYEWRNGATVVASGTDPFFDVTASGSYTVTAIAEGGTCSQLSNSVSVTVAAGSASGPATPTNNGPVCIGSTLNLSVNNVSATQYNWTGPEGYTGTGLTPTPVSNFQSKNAGRYYVEVVVGTCIAQRASTVVDAVDVPEFLVTYSGSTVVCPPDTKTLSVSPNLGTFSYQWFEKTTGLIAGATSPTYTPAVSGEYFVKAQYTVNPSCATVESQAVKIVYTSSPTAAFTAPAEACMGQNITFVDQSTIAPGVDSFYNWEFGDSGTSTDKDPVYKYNSAATRNVKLTVTYKDGACANSVTKSILIKTAPVVSITNPENKYKLCDGDSLKLEVLGSFTSFSWNTNATTSSIFVKEPGTYTVDVAITGCILNASRLIEELPEAEVTVTADPPQIDEGQSAQLDASGLTSYTWEPAETLSNPSIANPIASPVATTAYKVKGKNGNGCAGEAIIEVIVKGEPIVNKLKPRNFFSPNDTDDKNPTWKVEKIDTFTQCGVAIYDDKGIKVFEAKPYLNDWDGTFNGKKLPDGVYYYIIRCDGEENKPRKGSITLLR